MVYVVERYLPGLSRADLLPRLSRLEPVIEELRGKGAAVRYLGSAIVLEDEACFCQFEASSVAAVAEANRKAGLPFDRIVPAVLVQPTPRSSEMSLSTSLTKTTERRWSHQLAAIAALVAVTALAAWAVTTYVVDSNAQSTHSSAPSQESVLRSLTPAGRQYVLGIMSMTPAEVTAAFNTSPKSVPSHASGSRTRAVRSSPSNLAPVLRALTPRERRYVLGIASLTPLQLWAAFGTTPTPPVLHRGTGSTTAPGATTSR